MKPEQKGDLAVYGEIKKIQWGQLPEIGNILRNTERSDYRRNLSIITKKVERHGGY